jgi:hypothetical protein
MNTVSKCIYSLMMLELPMLQCCRLPTMLQCCGLPMLQAANTWRYRTASCFRARLPTAMLQAAYVARSQQRCSAAGSLCCNAARSPQVATSHSTALPATSKRNFQLQCYRLLMLQCCWLPTMRHNYRLPMLQCCSLHMLQCCRLSTRGDAALDRTASYFPTRLPTAMLQSAYVAMLQPPYAAMLQAANTWRYRTACCFRARLPAAMLPAAYAAMLPASSCPLADYCLLKTACRKTARRTFACLLTPPYIQLQSGHAPTAGSLAQCRRSPPGDS